MRHINDFVNFDTNNIAKLFFDTARGVFRVEYYNGESRVDAYHETTDIDDAIKTARSFVRYTI